MADVQETIQSKPIDESGPQKPNEQTGKAKKKRRKTRAQRYKEKQVQVRPDDRREIVKNNDNLVKFYKAQSFLKDGEFDVFIEGLRTTLPASFRINAFDYNQAAFLRNLVKGSEFNEFLISPPKEDQSGKSANDATDKMDDQDDNVAKSTTTITKPPVLEPLCWYPQEFAWQMNITRVDLKKTPVLQKLHKFIMAETDNGFISRQESVSMIPPLLLDIRRGQNILDMCAAPGSKTAQLLEYLKFNIFNNKDHGKIVPTDPFDDGLIVANDVDNKRCYMLVHQASRLNSPNCVIINEDASRLPNMKTLDQNGEVKNIKFDRILCDVPCSGDGTLRKNPDVWRKWTVGNANNFHGMQLKIAKRGLELLEKDGLLVYSTCSMNPAEDESVIAAILRLSKGSVVLEDLSEKLRGLKYRPGVSKWVVMNRDTEVVASVDDIKPEQASQIHASLFPPTEEEAKEFNLHRCIRMLPHLQDTGAFFVAVLRKLTSSLPWEDNHHSSQGKADAENNNGDQLKTQSNPKKRRYAGFKEDPFFFMDKEDPDCVAIKEAYGIRDDFPYHQLVHRCKSGKKRSIYLVSKRTRDFISLNQEQPDRNDSIKIINGGMRLFARAATDAGFRICQDGVNDILPYVKDDLKVPINRDDLVTLLKTRAVGADELSSREQLQSKVKPGSFILMYKHEDTTGNQQSFMMPLVAWRGERCIALYVSNTFRVHLCALVQLNISEAADCVAPPALPATGAGDDTNQDEQQS